LFCHSLWQHDLENKFGQVLTIVVLLGYQVLKTNRASLVSSYGMSSITWLGIGIIKHKKQSASMLFRQIQYRHGLVGDKMAA
jgi:hypothetical protein